MKKKVLLLGNHGFVIYNFRKELIQELLGQGYEVYISLPKDEIVDKMVNGDVNSYKQMLIEEAQTQ